MTKLPDNYVRLQNNPERVACLDGSKWHGWLFSRHPDGQLVSIRKLEDWEVMQAEDQQEYGIVLDGGHNVETKSGYRFG